MHMEHSDSDESESAGIEEWKTNFDEKGGEKVEEIGREFDGNVIFESYVRATSRLPEAIRKANLREFAAADGATSGIDVSESAGVPSVSQENENKVGQKRSVWSSRLRGAQKVFPSQSSRKNMKTPACGTSKSVVMNTPAGSVQLPWAITPKVQDGNDIKFRPLRPEEVAFSVAGTPVVAVDETRVNESMEIVSELLHTEDAELSPETRHVVHGMKQLIGKIRTSEFPKQL